MNNEIPIGTGITQVPPEAEVKKPSIFDKPPFDKVPKPLQGALKSFYANKKIFWPITILFGIMFLIIILGLLFGSPAPVVIKPKVTPSPFIQPTPAPCASTDTLCVTGNQLKDLNGQINSLDLKQSRLAPPQINYDISF